MNGWPTRCLLAAALWLAAIAVAPAETRVALVIGNGGYSNVARLDNPGRDADAVARALRDAGFGSVQVEHDLGRESFLAALRRFESLADHADWALVYFAGHGIEVGGVNYLIPTDAALRSDRDIEDETVSLPQVQRRLAGASKLRIVILDACRDNPFAVAMRRNVVDRAVTRGLARPDLPQTGSIVAFAAQAKETAADGGADPGGNGPYAAALVKNLAEPDLEVNLFFRRVRADVLAATGEKQLPATYESLPADRFVFRPAGPVLAAPEIAAPAIAAPVRAAPVLPAPAVPLVAALPVPAPVATYSYVTGLDPRGDNWLALKSAPDIAAPRLTKMGPGTRLSVVGRNGAWSQVRLLDGTIGWASSRYIDCCIAR